MENTPNSLSKGTSRNYYIAENIIDHDGQLAILKLSEPQVFVLFDYAEGYMTDYEEWAASIAHINWLSGHVPDKDEVDAILTDCWNFLALHEREEEARAERGDYDDEEEI